MLEETGIEKMQEEREELDKKVKEYVLKKDSIETPGYKLTVVRGFMRKWDGDALAKLVPKGMFLKLVDYVPNPEKIDELVKAKKISEKQISPAYIETPKAPYVKITKKTQSDSGEADRVAEALA